jgi:nicotinate-nucleotide pyrophosphorylase (carboxylating)
MSTLSPDDLARFYAKLSSTGLVRRLLELARDEDLGPSGRDLTSALFIDEDATLRCVVVARQPGVVAGFAAIDDLLDVFGFSESVQIQVFLADGSTIEPGDRVAIVEGNARAILTLERTMLNLVGRLSGVATVTRSYVRAMGTSTSVELYDTRKTTPGLRVLEKYAVRCGGGFSHRLGLHDAVMVKDNHLAGLGLEDLGDALKAAGERVRAVPGPVAFFEVEVDSIVQFERVLAVGSGVVDIVLLDNFEPSMLAQAVSMRDRLQPGLQLEASGGITLETIGEVAQTGVDRISVGGLTHSAASLDFGLDAL